MLHCSSSMAEWMKAQQHDCLKEAPSLLNTFLLYILVSPFPLIYILRSVALNFSLLFIILTAPLFIIHPCIIPTWALSWLTNHTIIIIDLIGICFGGLRGIFKLILRDTAPGQLKIGEINLLYLWQWSFLAIALSPLPLPPSSGHFSMGTPTSSDVDLGHSISSASLSVPSFLQAVTIYFYAYHIWTDPTFSYTNPLCHHDLIMTSLTPLWLHLLHYDITSKTL